MKRNVFTVLSSITMLCLSALTTSCGSDQKSDYCVFTDYSVFSENKSSWKEPTDYSFTYKFSCGDGVVLEPFKVNVTNGTGIVTYTGIEENLTGLETEFGDIQFNTISEIYEYFDQYWEDVSADTENNKGYQIEFSVKYEDVDECGSCPVRLNETRTLTSHEEVDGYGGVLITVSDFKIQ